MTIKVGDKIRCGDRGSHPGKTGTVDFITPSLYHVVLDGGDPAYFEREGCVIVENEVTATP